MKSRYLLTLVTLIFGKLLNSSEVVSKFTANNLITGFNDTHGNAILLTAKQIKHKVISSYWWIPNKVYFTYLVTCECVDILGKVVITTGNYPHMCFNWMHYSKIGHHRAVNAHIDCKGIKARVGD